MLETQDTVIDRRHGGSRPARGRWIIWALGAAIAILTVALGLALTRNVALQKRATQAERIADERAGEIREMSRQCGIAARVSLEKLSDPEEAAADDQTEVETSGLDGGIDTTPPPPKAEKW